MQNAEGMSAQVNNRHNVYVRAMSCISHTNTITIIIINNVHRLGNSQNLLYKSYG